MFEISREDQERLIRMAAAAAAHLAVEVILATEPFKSALPPRQKVIEISAAKPLRKRKAVRKRKPPTNKD
jgi:hypothetical protein